VGKSVFSFLGGLETCTDEISSSEYLAASPSRARPAEKLSQYLQIYVNGATFRNRVVSSRLRLPLLRCPFGFGLLSLISITMWKKINTKNGSTALD
jgi:hypothetical protein